MCEDYPCCGHTNEDPCGVQWYDAPDAFDTSVNPHALCDHESGDCDVDYDGEGSECDLDYDLDVHNGHVWCYTHDCINEECPGSDDPYEGNEDAYIDAMSD